MLQIPLRYVNILFAFDAIDGKCIVRCVCGETFETGSTKKEMKVDICSKCHPFYTGKQKLVDTGGRVDRFKKRFNME